MDCCAHCEDTEDLFDRNKAKKELRRYRKSGPPNTSTRLLIDALKTLDLQDKRLLTSGAASG